MAEYQAGSVEAFDRLHDALAADLKAYLTALVARRHARRRPAAGDVPPDASIARAPTRRASRCRPWVFAIAKRVFLMYRRSTVRRARHELRRRSRAAATRRSRRRGRAPARAPAGRIGAPAGAGGRASRVPAASSVRVFVQGNRRAGWASSPARPRFDRAAPRASCGRCCERGVMSDSGFRSTGALSRTDRRQPRARAAAADAVAARVDARAARSAARGDRAAPERQRGDLDAVRAAAHLGRHRVCRRCSDCGCSRSASARRCPAATCRARALALGERADGGARASRSRCSRTPRAPRSCRAGREWQYWVECVVWPMALGAPFMVLATLMAVRAFPTRPAIAGALCGLSAGVLSDAGLAAELLDLRAGARHRLARARHAGARRRRIAPGGDGRCPALDPLHIPSAERSEPTHGLRSVGNAGQSAWVSTSPVGSPWASALGQA